MAAQVVFEYMCAWCVYMWIYGENGPRHEERVKDDEIEEKTKESEWERNGIEWDEQRGNQNIKI